MVKIYLLIFKRGGQVIKIILECDFTSPSITKIYKKPIVPERLIKITDFIKYTENLVNSIRKWGILLKLIFLEKQLNRAYVPRTDALLKEFDDLEMFLDTSKYINFLVEKYRYNSILNYIKYGNLISVHSKANRELIVFNLILFTPL